MTREQVTAGLEAAADDDGMPAALRRSRRLPRKLRRVTATLLDQDLPYTERLGPADLARSLDDATPRQRRRLFRAVAPALAPELEATWGALRDRPYTIAWNRRAFRAPGSAAATATARGRWLTSVAPTVARYPQDLSWLAAWAAHLPGQHALGELFATVVDDGHVEVRDVLVTIATNAHDVGEFNPSVPIALLGAADPVGWDAMERLLLAARRQEGLRQSILEAVDLAHPAAFRRMVRLVLDHDLLRFAAAIRAAGVWFGEAWEVRDASDVAAALEVLLSFLDDPDTATAALGDPDPMRTYLALWAMAHHDAGPALVRAAELLDHDEGGTRLAAARLLRALQLPDARAALVPALGDDDLRVVAVAYAGVAESRWTADGGDHVAVDAFDGLWALQDRLDGDHDVPVGLVRPATLSLSRSDTCDALVHHLDDRPPAVLAPLVGRMSPQGRAAWARALAADPVANRAHLLGLASDLSGMVRHVVFVALEDATAPTEDEARDLEQLLSRKPSDLRRGVLVLLLAQDEPAVLDSVRRLAAGGAGQRRAAVELLVEVGQAHLVGGSGAAPASQQAGELAHTLVDQLDLDQGDRDRLGPLLGDDGATARLQVVEELVDHDARTRVVRPTGDVAAVVAWDAAVANLVASLDRWLVEHRDVEVTLQHWHGPEQRLLGDVRHLPRPRHDRPWEDQLDDLPLPEILEQWWDRTGPDWSDSRLELLLLGPVWALLGARATARDAELPLPPSWHAALADPWTRTLQVLGDARFPHLAQGFLDWLGPRELTSTGIDGLLATATAVLGAVPDEAIASLPTVADLVNRPPGTWGLDHRVAARDFRRLGGVRDALDQATRLEALRPDAWSVAQRGALWHLLRFLDEPAGNHDPAAPRVALDNAWAHDRPDLPDRPGRFVPDLAVTVRAVGDGVATTADLADVVLGETTRADGDQYVGRHGDPLGRLTRRRPDPLLADHDWLPGFVDIIRDRILEVELARGDLPTAASRAARQLRTVHGADEAIALMDGLGRQRLVRGFGYGAGVGRPAVFSHLVRVSFPSADDTPDTFAAAVARHGLSERRLCELAVYAPQWAPFVQDHLGWDGLVEAVWWLHAHTKDDRWSVDRDVRAEWEALAHERTPLTAEELVNGAVDVDWFHRMHERLGTDRFDRLLTVAKYASSGGGHTRARLFAEALRGTADPDEVHARMEAKRHQDSVRASGLLPLPDDPDDAAAETLARYQRLMAWQKGSRKFGSQRRASEALAVRIALDNLARTAGYADPQRLRWAMESEAVADLADGPVTATVGDVTVALSLTDEGTPRLAVDRAGRVLKNIPRDAAKDPGVVALKGRVADLRDQASRMRTSLEEACVRGDAFAPDELADLATHPVLATQLATLVVVDRTGRTARPVDGGTRLVDPDGTEVELDGVVRIAHPVDLLAEGRWSDWQRLLFDQRVRQPFRQVFRQLYVPVGAEVGGATRSDRWAGHQVQSRQAAALFGARGWVLDHEGGARRTFHDHATTAHVRAMGLYGTPGEVEDTTLESVWFVRRDPGTVAGGGGLARPVPVDEVPPRLFSEVMRDLDLVVSVAHAGGVDPEATASTVEMRAALVDETAHMLGLDNVETTDNHVMVAGALASYSVHLGSGVVHRRPGNAVCIVPVGAQHRGRLFLPFVDDDPRTAEVVSKVVLLARDDQVQDPSILAQLRG